MVWSMKRKRDPAGDIIKWKARLCAHGGQQQYGVNYWETYAPVVSWSTVRLILILSLILNWHTRSLDFVLAYPQADVKTNIYMRLPKYTKVKHANGPAYLKLRKNLYGLKDAGLTWFQHVTKGLIDRGFKPSDIDQCVFTKGKTILVLYVDDAILFGPDKTEIDQIVESLKQGFSLTDDGEMKDYLGVRVKRQGNKVIMTQPRMIEKCLQLVGIPIDNNKVKQHDTPAEPRTFLHKDSNGLPRQKEWNYRSVIGALMYLMAMTRPELAYAVHQCSRFSQDPRRSHEQAVMRICRYLKSTQDKGLILNPDLSKGFECYVDADWAGNWHKDYADDPSTALSRTGYVITYAGCPVVWASKLQPLITLSTTESEYVALSTALREVIYMMNLLKELQARGIDVPFTTPKVKCRVFEDNSGCVEIAREYKMRPRTKHIAVRYHHFRDHVKRGDIQIEHISTKEQIADIFTKALPLRQFQHLRDKLLGWDS
jgi:hypothetical protein